LQKWLWGVDSQSQTVADIDCHSHQASIRIMDATAHKLNCRDQGEVDGGPAPEHVSGFSPLLAVAVSATDDRTGQHLIFGVGGGFTWGSAFVRW
jgi:3-oxoacyl-[acyl-carrier-protein] synthase III